MKQIKIKSLKVRNFNGISKVDVEFNEGTTEIVSPSGMGKSSLVEAVQYACGLDVADMYPHIDKYVIKDLETEIELTLDVDGNTYVLVRKNKQKWGVDKLTGAKTFKGNETSCVFDGVEVNTLTLYKEKVSDLLGIDMKKLPLVLDISTFNNLHWEDQRKILTELLHLDEIVANLTEKDEFNLLKEDLQKGKSEVDIQKVLNALKRDINNEVERNQILVTDKTEQLTVMLKESFENVEATKENLKAEIEKLQTQSAEDAKIGVSQEKQKEYETLRARYYELKKEIDNKKLERDTNIRKANSALYDNEQSIAFEERKLAQIKSNAEDLKMELAALEDETFDESKKVCPTCKRDLPQEQIDQLLADFAKRKEERKASIAQKAQNLATDERNAQDRLNTLAEQNNALKAQINAFNEVVIDESQVAEMGKTVKELFESIQEVDESEIQIETKKKIAELQEQYDECVRKLARKQMAEDLKAEIEGIKNRGRELALQDQQRVLKQNQLYEYIKQKIELVNSTVNQNFRDVKFIFFSPLTANADKPYELTCTVTYHGVVYQKLSTGEKIFANARVFEGLARLLNIDIFTFIDERQSTTLDLGLNFQNIELYTQKDLSECNFQPVRIQDLYSINDTIKE